MLSPASTIELVDLPFCSADCWDWDLLPPKIFPICKACHKQKHNAQRGNPKLASCRYEVPPDAQSIVCLLSERSGRSEAKQAHVKINIADICRKLDARVQSEASA